MKIKKVDLGFKTSGRGTIYDIRYTRHDVRDRIVNYQLLEYKKKRLVITTSRFFS